jgi:small ligand-binding sensory domain FIST
VREQHKTRALAALPIALLGPVAGFFVALHIGPIAAWSTLAGMIVTHRAVLWKVKEAT